MAVVNSWFPNVTKLLGLKTSASASTSTSTSTSTSSAPPQSPSLLVKHGGIIKKKKKKRYHPPQPIKKKPLPSPPSTKNLNTFQKRPKFIKCGNQVIQNHLEPVTVSYNVKEVRYFTGGQIQDNLIQILQQYGRERIIMGRIAWFSSNPIIEALNKAKKVCIIVNDEDYSKWGFGTVTKEKYSTLPAFGNTSLSQVWGRKMECTLNFNQFDGKYWEAVRCFGQECVADEVGGPVKGGKMINSIMHVKELVICDDNDMPRWLWTGSLNFTNNSVNNVENGIFLDDPKIARQSFLAFCETFLVSKPLRW